MNKRLIMAVFLVLLLQSTTGCWNYVELNKRAVVTGVALDRTDEKGKIEITVEVMKPAELLAPTVGGGGGGDKEKAFALFSSTGSTVFEAIRKITRTANRKLYWEHNRIIVIGEELAREGIAPAMDFFIRDHESRARAWVLVSKGNASDIMRAESVVEKIPAREIEDLIKAREATSEASALTMHEVNLRLSSATTSAAASWIELVEKREKEEGPTFRLTGTAVFKKDRFVGTLNGPETRGLSWIVNEIKSGIIVVRAPGEENGEVGLEIIRASSKIKPEIKGGKLSITVEVNEEGNIGDQLSDKNLTTPDMIKALGERKEAAIKSEIEACIRKAQKEFESDIFGFGEEVHRRFPREWKKLKKNWDEIFPDIDVEVKVDAKIRRTGMVTEPVRAE